MNTNPTRPPVVQLKRTVTYAVIFMTIGGSSRIAAAQIYESGSIVSGTSIGDWVSAYMARCESERSGQIQNDMTQRAEQMQFEQPGSVFFYPYSTGSYNRTIEIEVPEGAPILVPFGLIGSATPTWTACSIPAT